MTNSLKDLRLRITSVRSTQKITAAMKMVATAKLRKAQERLDYARNYAYQLKKCVNHALNSVDDLEAKPLLLTGNPDGATFILVLATDRGLCGGYNTSIIREVKAFVNHIRREKSMSDHSVYIAAVGRKVKNTLQRECVAGRIAASFYEFVFSGVGSAANQEADVNDMRTIAKEIITAIEAGDFGSVYVVTGRIRSILSQPIVVNQLVPLLVGQKETIPSNSDEATLNDGSSLYEPAYTIFEPKLERLLVILLADNLKAQLNTLQLENTACEHAARMTAMDNASRNARDMIQNLQLCYNQGRQAQITNELIEIISGSNVV